MHKRIYSLLSVGGVLSGTMYIVACSSSSGGGNNKTVVIMPDAPVDAKPCAAMPSYSPTLGSGQVAIDLGSGSGYTEELEWQGDLTETPLVFLTILAISGGGTGSQGTPDWPTGNVTSPKTGLDLATDPDVLVVLGANFDQTTMQAQDLYVSIGGTLDFTGTSTGAVGQTLAGDIMNGQFQHYDYAQGAGFTGPDPDNCMSSIASMQFSAPITMGSGSAVVPGEGWQQISSRKLVNR